MRGSCTQLSAGSKHQPINTAGIEAKKTTRRGAHSQSRLPGLLGSGQSRAPEGSLALESWDAEYRNSHMIPCWSLLDYGRAQEQ
jgi:hypothetical protein